MKKLLIFLCLSLMVGCTTTGQAYLPHTSRVFHAKKNCVGCYDPNPIVFQSVQAAANSSGIAPCSMCVKAQSASPQGYKAYNYSASTPISSSTSYRPPSFFYSTTTPSYSTQSINNLNTGYGNNQTTILNRTPLSSGIIPTIPTLNNRGIAENGSYYGEISEATGRPKTVPVRGYYRTDGTYVRGHYRSPPRNKASSTGMTESLYKKYSNPPDSFDYNKTYIPPVKKYEYNPIESPFKGKGLLDERYSNPSVDSSGILPRIPGN